MIPPQHSSAFHRACQRLLCVILVVLPAACAPPMATKSASEEPITGIPDARGASGGTSLAGRLDAGSVMSESWDPSQAYSEGLAESSSESETPEESGVELAASSPEDLGSEELPVEGPSMEINVPSKDLEPSLLPLPLAKVATALDPPTATCAPRARQFI